MLSCGGFRIVLPIRALCVMLAWLVSAAPALAEQHSQYTRWRKQPVTSVIKGSLGRRAPQRRRPHHQLRRARFQRLFQLQKGSQNKPGRGGTGQRKAKARAKAKAKARAKAKAKARRAEGRPLDFLHGVFPKVMKGPSPLPNDYIIAGNKFQAAIWIDL
ncbi:MAG: hypothetical protein JRH20_19100, partial [Deltaproteobacteria bacterium]|nr:hypothetical protein [Deltaproteobacteria bacterium]